MAACRDHITKNNANETTFVATVGHNDGIRFSVDSSIVQNENRISINAVTAIQENHTVGSVSLCEPIICSNVGDSHTANTANKTYVAY